MPGTQPCLDAFFTDAYIFIDRGDVEVSDNSDRFIVFVFII